MIFGHVLVVDDDPHHCEIIRDYGETEGLQVAIAHDCKTADQLLSNFKPDVIVLDVMLANENGIDWCRTIRETTNAVIIFLSSRQEDDIKIQALADGGDDYITKPFSAKVLMAKIKAHLRRMSVSAKERYLEFPGITLDFVTQNVYVNGKWVELSKKEFSILAYMAQAADKVVDSATLFQLIWATDHIDDIRTVAVHISNLRKKIESDPRNPKRIVTVRGVGYKFNSFLSECGQ